MFEKLYYKILKIAEKKFAPMILSLVAFWESILFPLPPDILLIPMSLANKNKALYFAGLTTVFSVFGGLTGYFLGLFFWAEIGRALINSLGYDEAFSTFSNLYIEYGILVVIIGAFTPFPFKVVAILSGVMGFSVLNFFLAATFSRGIRFFTIAGIIFFWGDQIDSFLKKYLGLLLFIVGITLIGMYLVLK